MKKVLITALAAFSMTAAAASAEVSVHDPSIIKSNGTYYIFGTHITAAKSTDLINWTEFTNGYTPKGNILFGDLSENLAGSFAWAGEDDSDCKGGYAVWAPDVYYNENYLNSDGSKGAYLMYYSASSTYIRSCIGLAVSKDIEGPYTYVDTLVYSGFTQNDAWDADSKVNKNYRNTNLARLISEGKVSGYSTNWGVGTSFNNSYAPNCIDPCIYDTPDGKIWMVYGSWSGGIFALEIDPSTGLAIYPGVDGSTAGGNPIDRYFGVRLAGGNALSGEGPFIYYDGEAGYYYLLDTYEWLGEDGGYHIRAFRSKNPDGPFVDPMGHNALYANHSLDYQGLKLFGNYRFDEMTPAYKSGGHCSALIDDDGRRYLFYHTRFSERGGYFEARVHEMFVNSQGWPVVAPYRYAGDNDIDSVEMKDIAGVYQFIDHGSATNIGSGYKGATSLYIGADGTVTGAAKGECVLKGGKEAVLNLDIGNFSGVFHRQKNENGELVLTFTGAGTDNNGSVWAVKSNEAASLPLPVQTVSFEDGLDGAVTVARPGNASEVNPTEVKKVLSYEKGITGKALRMDGAYGLKLPELGPKKSYAVSLWIKPDSLSQFGPIVAASPDFVSGVWLNMTTVDPGNISRIWSRRADLDIWPWEDKAGVFTIGQWQHLIISVDGEKNGSAPNTVRGSLYIDGARVSQGDVAAGILENGGSIYIGANAWDAYFKGLVSDIRVYDVPLTMAEAREIYEDSRPLSINSASSGDNILVRVNGKLPTKARLGLIAYKSGSLLNVQTSEVFEREKWFHLPLAEADRFKIVLWDGLESMEPLTKPIMVENK